MIFCFLWLDSNTDLFPSDIVKSWKLMPEVAHFVDICQFSVVLLRELWFRLVKMRYFVSVDNQQV